MSEKISRRTVLSGIGATTAGTSIAYISTRPTQGQQTEIQLGNLEIPDPSYQAGNEDITNVDVRVDANYKWESSHTPDKVILKLLIGDSEDTMQAIQTESLTDLTKSQSGSATLSGDVTSTYHYSVQDFQPSTDSVKSTRVVVGLQIELWKDGEIIDKNTISELVSVAVDGTELTATTEVGGSGTIQINQ